MVTIVLLALVAAFLGLRLYSVLGKRSGHEQEPLSRPAPASERNIPPARKPNVVEFPQQGTSQHSDLFAPTAESGLRAIAAADRQFDIESFSEGAKAAYGIILEAYWKGDKDTLADLCDDSVLASFSEAIDAREAAGETLENRLIRIDGFLITDALLTGREARIDARFDADIAALMRDSDGNVIGGSMTDAVETNDLWTFARHIGDEDPNWRLVETDNA